MELDDHNRVLQVFDSDVELNIQPATYQKTLKVGAAYSRSIEIVPKAAEVRVVCEIRRTAIWERLPFRSISTIRRRKIKTNFDLDLRQRCGLAAVQILNAR